MAKSQSFTEYLKNWKKKMPIRFNTRGIPIDNLGEGDGVIRLSAPNPMKKGKKRDRIHTRIKKAGDPRVGVINNRNAAHRRKSITVET